MVADTPKMMQNVPALPGRMPGRIPGRIMVLPALVANQIAAGEVVERPASVVKELLENALDAGACRITLELEGGGVELVRVSDDGKGIHPEDLPLALAPHATSKVSGVQDLDRVATLGFRGEALASIASVSRLSLRSRVAGSDEGWEVRSEGELQDGPRPQAGPPGTTVTVRNLFFNTPARRKFLRTTQTEQERCVEVFEHVALAHPAVAFTLRIDGKLAADHPPEQGPRARALSVLGKEIASQVVEVRADALDDTRGVTLWGLAGLPSIARGSAKGVRIFVNGRWVRDRTIQHAVSEAYRGLIEPGRYPTVLLMLETGPEAVDVNVHPQKAEVRFRDTSMVHSAVLRALREGLQRADLTPNAHDLRSVAWSPATGGVTRELLGAQMASATGLPMLEPTLPTPGERDERMAAFFSTYRPGAPEGVARAVPAPGQPARLLQVRDSFVVTQDEEGVVIIDQHALHERAMYEFLCARVLASGSLESQRLLVPTPVETGSRDAEKTLGTLGPLLAAIGIEAQLLSPTCLGVLAFPSFLTERGVEIGAFMLDLFRKVEAGEFDLSRPAGDRAVREEALRDVLDMMSCKAAVKAGDRLRGEELEDLVRLREDVERSSNCPHGRPTSIRLTFKELEKLFGRA